MNSDKEQPQAEDQKAHRGAGFRYDDPFASCFPESPEYVRIDCDAIKDAASFHDVWTEAMAFPTFYGRNMNSWIDCMSDLRLDSKMTRFLLDSGQILHIELAGSASFRARLPELFTILLDAATAVNVRYRASGYGPALAFVLV